MIRLAIATCATALFLAGCASKSSAPPPKTAQQRQDDALRDPFHYKPDFSDTTVSDGDTTKLDKQGLKRDLDEFFR